MIQASNRRAQSIEQVAGILRDLAATDLTGEYDDLHRAARRINDTTGWTYDLPVPDAPDHWLRCAGAVLSDADLARAVTLAREWLDHPDAGLAS